MKSNRVKKQALCIGYPLQAVCYINSDTSRVESKESNTHSYTPLQTQTHTVTRTQSCSDHAGTLAMTLRPRLNRANREQSLWPGRRAARGMDKRTEGMKDSHTEMEVNRKAAEQSELVSGQRNAGGEAEGEGGSGVSMRKLR